MKKDSKNMIIIVMIVVALVLGLIIFALISIAKDSDRLIIEETKEVVKELELPDYEEVESGLPIVDRFWDKDKKDITDWDIEQNMLRTLRLLEENKFVEASNEGDKLFSTYILGGDMYEDNKGFYEDLPLLAYMEEMFELDIYGAMDHVKTLRSEYTFLAGALRLDSETFPYVVQSQDSLVPDLNVGFHINGMEDVDLDEKSIPMDNVRKYNKDIDKITKLLVNIAGDELEVYFTRNKGEDFVNLVMFHHVTGETRLKTQQEWNEIYEELYNNLNKERKEIRTETEIEIEAEIEEEIEIEIEEGDEDDGGW